MTSLNALVEAAKLVEYNKDGSPKSKDFASRMFSGLVSMDVKVADQVLSYEDDSNSHKNADQRDPNDSEDSTSSSCRVKSTRSNMRETHNKLEKNRRAELKNYFLKLKSNLPRLSDRHKASNVAILTEAMRHIKELHEQDVEMVTQRSRLQKCRLCLEERIKMLKEEIHRQNLQTQLFAQVENEKKKVDVEANCKLLKIETKTVQVQANEEDIFEQMKMTDPKPVVKLKTSSKETIVDLKLSNAKLQTSTSCQCDLSINIPSFELQNACSEITPLKQCNERDARDVSDDELTIFVVDE